MNFCASGFMLAMIGAGWPGGHHRDVDRLVGDQLDQRLVVRQEARVRPRASDSLNIMRYSVCVMNAAPLPTRPPLIFASLMSWR